MQTAQHTVNKRQKAKPAKKESKDELDPATRLIQDALAKHINNRSPNTLKDVQKYFSYGRKFGGTSKLNLPDVSYPLTFKKGKEEFSCNPFAVKSTYFKLDLLTDSGTSRLTDEQVRIKEAYMKLVPSIEMFSYARCTPREHLEEAF